MRGHQEIGRRLTISAASHDLGPYMPRPTMCMNPLNDLLSDNEESRKAGNQAFEGKEPHLAVAGQT
jgi:hypothetical protein